MKTHEKCGITSEKLTVFFCVVILPPKVSCGLLCDIMEGETAA